MVSIINVTNTITRTPWEFIVVTEVRLFGILLKRKVDKTKLT